MKRGLAMVLALFLAGTALPAVAEGIPYTLEQKVAKQLGAGSGLKGTVTFSSSGNAIPLINAGTWQILSLVLPLLSADITYITPQGVRQGESRFSISVKASGNDIAQATVSGKDKLFALESNLLPDGLFGAAAPEDMVVHALQGSEEGWPPLWLAALSIMTAGDEWNTASQSALATYTAKLGVWLQAYTSLETIKDGSVTTGIRHTSVIPSHAVKAEAKQLLIDLYADDALLSLLQTRLTPGESTAYLQKGMMPSFFAAIDMLPLDADVSIVRAYDMQGRIRYEELTLPLAGAAGLSSLIISRELQDNTEPVTSVVCNFAPAFPGHASGAVLNFTVAQSAPAGLVNESIYSGTAAYTPESDKNTGYSVEGSQTADPVTALSYNLYLSEGAEIYDAASDLSTRGYEATLVVKPDSGVVWNSVSLSLTASLSSGSSPRLPTSITAALTLEDLVTGGRLSMAVDGRTTAPWGIPDFVQADVIRLDMMTAEEFARWLAQVLETAGAHINAAIVSLLPK